MNHHLVDVPNMEGLTQCSICGGAEGALPTDCPGKQIAYQQMEAIHQGRIDFVAGHWINLDEGEEL